ncbi:EAL domain-containing protein [Alicyclobacillus tolerans]|uniref:EAL domain-containing protein n=1 Tax=Alicyclobacillus tolerans TaxID=90970 RepID=UPI003B79CFEB
MAPSQVKLELTETVMLNSAVHLEMIKKLKDLGVMIAIDDFGTGYASFTYLLDIRPDVIKIDQSFIRKLAQVDKPDRDNERIVASMLTLARQLGISTVAEGVETVPQLQWLQQHGCDYIQGYLLGKPMPFVEFEKVVKYSTSVSGSMESQENIL